MAPDSAPASAPASALALAPAPASAPARIENTAASTGKVSADETHAVSPDCVLIG